MLGIVSTSNARHDAGSLALALTKGWSSAGQLMLFIDADTTGSSLAERYGAVVRSEYSPAARGLPSLIAAREPLNLKLIADHCYSLDREEGRRWALFAPRHPDGAKYAVSWLGERIGELKEIDRERNIVISSSLQTDEDAVVPLLKALPVLVLLAPVGTRDEAKALRSLCEDSGLLGPDDSDSPKIRCLILEGRSQDVGDNEIMGLTKLYVLGRLPPVEDEKLLRAQGGRKDRAIMRELDNIAKQISQVSGADLDRFAGDGQTALDAMDTPVDGREVAPANGNGLPTAQDGLELNPVGSKGRG